MRPSAPALLLAALPLLLPPAAARGREGEGPERAFLEVEGPAGDCWVGQPVRLLLRIGADEGFLREHAVPTFLRAADLPVVVTAPWLRALPGAEPAEEGAPPPAGPRGTLRVPVNDEVLAAERREDAVRGGRTFAVAEVSRTWVPVRPGEFAIEAPLLRYAWSPSFEEDGLGKRVPAERREATVRGPALRVRVLPLPAEGRPPGAAGAVGRFAVAAEASAANVSTDDTFRIVLRVEGEGNLLPAAAPSLEGVPGLHVFGVLEERAPRRRTFGYEVAATSPDLREVPPIPFAFFDPGPPAGWRVARTAPIPIRVRPGARAPGNGGGGETGGGPSPARGVLVLAGLAVAVVALLLLLRRRGAPGRE